MNLSQPTMMEATERLPMSPRAMGELLRAQAKQVSGHDHLTYLLTGSTVINGKGQDIDIVLGPVFSEDVLTDAQLAAIHDSLADVWDYTGADQYVFLGEEPGDKGYKMHCYRKGIYNILLVDRGMEKWDAALQVCIAMSKALGPTSKRQRVAVHKVLVDGMDGADAGAWTLGQVTNDYT